MEGTGSLNVERIVYWVRRVSRVVLEVFDGADDEPRAAVWLRAVARAALQTVDSFGPTMKPERIQGWEELLSGFVTAVFAAVKEETDASSDGDSGA